LSFVVARLRKTHASAVPSLPAPASALGINDAGTTTATTFVFHITLQNIYISKNTGQPLGLISHYKD
jgi:hypothetical protein